MVQHSRLHPAAARSLERWSAMVSSGDFGGLAAIVHPNAVFRSPVAHSAYSGAPALVLAIATVSKVFEDFAYCRDFVSEDGLNVALEFSARAGGKTLKGVDLIRFNAEGLIAEFEVMIRPLSGLQALAAEMASRLGGQLTAHKAS